METLPLILTGLTGALLLLVLALADRYSKGDEEEDDHDTHIEVASGDSGGGHSGGSHLGDTVTAEISNRKGGGTISLDSAVKSDELKHKKSRSDNQVSTGSVQCVHCGSINDDTNGNCWSCGSDPRGTLGEDKLNTVNERVKQGALDETYKVKKGEEPSDEPVDTPATPEEQKENTKTQEELGTTEEDIQNQEDIPIWRFYAGELIAWIDKWIALTNTHMKSILVVTMSVALFWGISLIYGAARLGPSGFASLVGASMIAVASSSLMALFALAPGRRRTTTFAYPFGVNAFLLPPVVIATYEPILSFVWNYSELTAIFILDTVFSPFNINTLLRQNFNMSEPGYFLMWFFLAFPIGWAIAGGVYLSRTTTAKMGDSRENNPSPNMGKDEQES